MNQDNGGAPVLVLIETHDDPVPTALRTLLDGFAKRAGMVFSDVLDGSSPVGSIVVAYGSGARRILGNARDAGSTAPVALIHPKAPDLSVIEFMQGRSIFITAGATDPDAPAAMIGELADALDAAGAKTDVHWNRGGSEVTDAELDRLSQWLSEARATGIDPRALPIVDEPDGDKGRYVINAPGGVFAEMTYSRVNEGLIIIDHTEVPSAFAGSGTGLRLLRTLIDDARMAGTKIIPLCPFAAAQFKKHPEWSDVLETKVRMTPKRG